MTSKDFQAELLEKVKEGVKPSDLKKAKSQMNMSQQPNPSQKPSSEEVLPPSIEISDLNMNHDGYQPDEGYESENETKRDKSPLKNTSEGKAKPASETFIKTLQNQIQSLKRQLQVYQDFKAADLNIKERQKQEIVDLKLSLNSLNQELTSYKETIKELQAKNQNLNKTIETMKNQAENKGENKQPTRTFLCSHCQQTKPEPELSRVFGEFKFCRSCSQQARKQAQTIKPQPQDFTCHLCEQPKQEIPTKMKLDKTLTEYLVCSTCKPTAKEFNEADLITDDLWEKYPYSSASEILELEFGIKRHEVKGGFYKKTDDNK